MYRLVRIEGFHDFRMGSELKFVLYNGLEYKSYDAVVNAYYITIKGYTNSQIFKDLGIENPMEYCEKYSKVTIGDFPVHKSIEDLKTTIKSFFDLNNHITIPSLYKVGDKVRIKSKYDENSKENDYPCSFTKKMLKDYGDKIYTIKFVNPSSITLVDCKHYLEPYVYLLDEDTYSWTAAMFESKQNDSDLIVLSELKIVNITQSDPETFKVIYSNDKHEFLSVRGSGFLNGHNKVYKKFEKFKDLTSLLKSELTCVKDNGFEPYIDKKENIWIFIDHLKYKFGTDKCKQTINPEFYKYLRKKPEIISDKTEVKQTKTQGNAYQFCKMRGTMRVGDVPEGNRICGKRSKASISSRPLGYRKVVGY